MSEQREKRRFSLFAKSLEELVEPLTRPALKAQGLAGTRIVTHWPSIIGPELAQHTQPEKLAFPQSQKSAAKKTGGTLTISCENGFATELQHRIPQILERLASYFGYQAVSRVVISHSWVERPEPPEQPKPKPTLTHAAPELTATVEDPELKAALKSLADTLAGRT